MSWPWPPAPGTITRCRRPRSIGYAARCFRAATNLARLWRAEGRFVEARNVLEPVRDRFTDGLDTPDLVAASALLASLKESDASPPPEPGK
jgi:hypothetical protein